MKTSHLLASFLIIVLGSVLTVSAQEDIARHRAVYKEINDQASTFQKVTTALKIEDTSYTVTGWLQDGAVRKIDAQGKDAAKTSEEYYLVKEKPVFVLYTHNQLEENGKVGPRIEERFYFSEDQNHFQMADQ